MDALPFVSVVISFRNEAEVLPELINRLRKNLDPLKISYELIFVNDASTDNSPGLLMEKAKSDRRIKTINMSRRFGVFPCVMAGMKFSKGEAVICMDADLQDPPEAIPGLIDKWKAGADVVHATRIAREGEPAFKKWITGLGYRILRFTSEGINLPVDAGDFKLLSRRVVGHLLELKEEEPFLKGLVPWIGFRQESVTYRRQKRFAGKSHFPFLRAGTIKRFVYGLAAFSSLPLYIAFFMGLVSFGAAFIYLISIIIKNCAGAAVPGWSALTFIVLFLGAIQLLGIGILGLYLGRVYNEVKQRPGYIIESVSGFDNEGKT